MHNLTTKRRAVERDRAAFTFAQQGDSNSVGTLLKRFFFVLTALFSLQNLVALPGITPEIPDISGQYVYYQDNSFERKSFIGIIYYDDKTYALRYFAPETGKNENYKPEKDVCVFFTLDPNESTVKLTGERIVTTITPDDTVLINYIHDFLYEMTSRRQKTGYFTGETNVLQDYEQFGGKVNLYYNSLIPIFNLEKIVSVDKKPILFIVTAGQVISSEDESFMSFRGIPEKTTARKHSFTPSKKMKQQDFSYQASEHSEPLQFKLDSGWTQSADNFFSLKNTAIFTVNEISLSAQNISPKAFQNFLVRRFVLGTDKAYPDWTKIKITKAKDGIFIQQTFFNAESENFTCDFKFLKNMSDSTAGVFSMTVYADAYNANKNYFDSIVHAFQ